jgi:hypothetical protein
MTGHTSAWWRAATLPTDLGSLLQRAVLDERFWITPIVRMELLYYVRTTAENAELGWSLTRYASCATTAPSPTQRRSHSVSWPSVPMATTASRPPTR